MQVKILVFNAEEDDTSFPPRNLPTFVKWVSEALESIPHEHRNSAEIDFFARTDYESAHVEITVDYSRPETDEEFEARYQSVARRAAQKEMAERKLLGELLQKYWDKP